MMYLLIGIVALATAFLTLFSGFGLGTLLMPAFALFFPLPLAIASTAIVHGLNNLLKVGLMFNYIDKSVMLHFGIPAMVAASLGALSMNHLAGVQELVAWSVLDCSFVSTPLKITLGSLILVFALFDLSGLGKKIQFDQKWLPLGGILSGFFGGLSGHQGAFRSMFLLKCGLSPKTFVSTQAIIAALVDSTRLIIYLFGIVGDSVVQSISVDYILVGFATVCAFTGTFIGKRVLEKTNIGVIHWITASLLLFIGSLLITGKI